MSWRFRKSISLGKGFKFNLGKKSLGLSVGTKGFHIGTSSARGTYLSTGISGTGLYNQTQLGMKKNHHNSAESSVTKGSGCLLVAVLLVLITVGFAVYNIDWIFGHLILMTTIIAIIVAVVSFLRKRKKNIKASTHETTFGPRGT